MNLKIYQVDAFTDKAFSGNPAAVCILDSELPEETMQNIAAEMNLSETAFLSPQDEGYRLRWFTPKSEVDLCGHATLASAYVLWQAKLLEENKTAIFHSNSGVLKAKKCSNEMIELDFPAEPPKPGVPPEELIMAIKTRPLYVGKNRFDYIVEVNEDFVKNYRPQLGLIARLNGRGLIITAQSKSDEYDFISRFFAPAEGIPEDPVTGSAHCCLGPYWKMRLRKDKFKAYQASKRGGELEVEVADDRVLLRGNAVTVVEGNLFF